MPQAGASAATRDVRVFARGRALSQATIRSTFIAAAVATCWTWVFVSPRYLAYRSPTPRTPWDSVPSTPARCCYGGLPSSLPTHARAACAASYCACGGSPTRRPCCCARVQTARAGHPWQSSSANSTKIRRRLVCAPCSHQSADHLPWGQRTRWCAPSPSQCSIV
jgi:hypothetical protein